VFEAQYVIVLCREGVGDENYVRHHLPLWRGMAYYHAARLMAGERCRWPTRHQEYGEWGKALAKQIKEFVGKCGVISDQ
jgi:hypothetical protein